MNKKGDFSWPAYSAFFLVVFVIVAISAYPHLSGFIKDLIYKNADERIKNNLEVMVKDINSLREDDDQIKNVPHGLDYSLYDIGVYKICAKDENPPSCSKGKAEICVLTKTGEQKACQLVDQWDFKDTTIFVLQGKTITFTAEDGKVSLS